MTPFLNSGTGAAQRLPGWRLAMAAWATAAALHGTASAQAASSKEDDLDFNYVQLGAGWAFPSKAPLKVNLGRGVELAGETQFSGGGAYSLVLGRQFYRDRDDDGTVRAPRGSREDEQDETKPMRVELELWTAQLKRQRIQFGNFTTRPNDSVQPQVVFLNLALPIAESDERVQVGADEQPRERGNEPLWRWWLGAGVGYASMKYPNASFIEGCDCLRAAEGRGLAVQLKLMGERRVGQDTYLFGQVGQVWLPGVGLNGGGSGSTNYDRINITGLKVGIRYRF